jgi:hypothetical protein
MYADAGRAREALTDGSLVDETAQAQQDSFERPIDSDQEEIEEKK